MVINDTDITQRLWSATFLTLNSKIIGRRSIDVQVLEIEYYVICQVVN